MPRRVSNPPNSPLCVSRHTEVWKCRRGLYSGQVAIFYGQVTIFAVTCILLSRYFCLEQRMGCREDTFSDSR